MSKSVGQPFIIENVAGAGGSVGVGRAVHAPPDGYSLSVGNWSTHVINGAMYTLRYDLVNDLEPVVRLASTQRHWLCTAAMIWMPVSAPIKVLN
jgi:tripartite-type tricarboxylate transporter receptor subunit TctC